METVMMCPECNQAEMKEQRENHRYVECGLDNIVLIDVMVRRCKHCGAHLVSIPRMAELHRTIALAIRRNSGDGSI